MGGFTKFSKKTKNTMKKFLNLVKIEQKGKENEKRLQPRGDCHRLCASGVADHSQYWSKLFLPCP